MLNVNICDIIGVKNCPTLPKPKFKFLVCVNPLKGLGFFINSEDRTHYYCLPILSINHRFLSHDSFISCSNLINYEVRNISCIKGSLSVTEMSLLMKHIEQGKRLVLSQKREILNSLQERLNHLKN